MKKIFLLFLFIARFLPDGFSQDMYQGPRPETVFSASSELGFLKEFNEKFKTDFDAPAQYAKAQTTGVDGWEMTLFSARKAQLAFYQSHPQMSQFSEPFKKYVENCIRWNYWHLLMAWPIVRTNAQATQQTVPSLPAVMLEGFDESKTNDETAMIAEPYRNFLFYYVTYFNSKSRNFAKYTPDDLHKMLPEKAGYARQHLNGKPYQYALARLLLDNCEKATPSSVREVFAALTATPNATAYTELVKTRCGDVMSRKDEPKPAAAAAKKKPVDPNVFSFLNQNGESVTLDDFKGKVVYLDIWASWCGPCIGEVPHSKKLYERLTKKQLEKVAFLYISIDDSEANWKNALEKHQLPGDQGWSKGGWRSRIVQYFGVQSIPRYILIDKKGQMADLNAKRPSTADAIYEDIVKLLEN
ncbi:TlpA family protein disulfide reductase [Larkinella punicea]|uniref:TlpA family protein disulfide reductase n=1 Tax=Larkinella punicea TaxID=2315727 RepID=A0A368JNC1_9BACT|nr:TlpA disulfide reductase family protein [Larkinella punicea]RCR68992.1 TlpA family protein disulfide reductase [Larkinella punicea]